MVAAVALGANRGDPARTLSWARDQLSSLGARRAQSHLYETAPLGPAQPRYRNAVILLETGLAPHPLLRALLAIEAQAGRDRSREERLGPRVLDLDLLLYGGAQLASPGLSLPHPRLHLRRFVLAPLCEVAPGWVHPVLRRPAAALLAELGPPASWDEVFPVLGGW